MSSSSFFGVKYVLGTKPAIGNGFEFSKNLKYNNLNKEITVGDADPVSGGITNELFTIPISNSIIKIIISKDENIGHPTVYSFEFQAVETFSSNLSISFADQGLPRFTIKYDPINSIAFIGTEDIRTGYVDLPIPIEGKGALRVIYLKYATLEKALLINVG